MTLLSFVIPCYRSEKTIEMVVNELIMTMSQRKDYDYEIITVNDYSPDGVYEVLKRLATENKRIKVINFAKNMGKHAAVLAGYSVARGKYIIELDDDYQCPGYDFWRLIDPLEKDLCDVAVASYKKKKESLIKRIGSRVNHRMTTVLLEKPKEICFENFTARKRFVCEEMIKYHNPYPYLEGLTLRVTHRVMQIPMEMRDRGDDNATGFTFKKSFALLLNGLTAFSVKPLRISTISGTVLAILGFLWGVYVVIKRMLNPLVTMGYSSMLAAILFIGGWIMIMLGLIGEYVGRIYISVNSSPQYVIRNTINLGESEDD